MNPLFQPSSRVRRLSALLIGVPLLAASLLPSRGAHAFAGEDPTFSHSWRHEPVTRSSSRATGLRKPPAPFRSASFKTVAFTAAANSDGAFLPLKNFAVRVDNVAPNAAGDQLEVLCTFKNQTEATQTLFGLLIGSVATDADGIGMMGRDFYSPTGEPNLIWEKKPIAPGDTMQVRILIGMPPGTAALKTLTLWEDTSLPQTIDISKVVWPGAKPAANPAAMELSNATFEFKPCGATLDVRFDGFRKARSGWYEAFFTFKNTADSTLRSDVLDFNSSALDLFTVGRSGKTQRYDELMRANGEKALWIPRHYAILPGTQARVRYTFSSKDKVPNPTKVTVSDRVSGTTLEWPVSAR